MAARRTEWASMAAKVGWLASGAVQVVAELLACTCTDDRAPSHRAEHRARSRLCLSAEITRAVPCRTLLGTRLYQLWYSCTGIR